MLTGFMRRVALSPVPAAPCSARAANFESIELDDRQQPWTPRLLQAHIGAGSASGTFRKARRWVALSDHLPDPVRL